MEPIRGKAFHCGDFVDTDVMSPGRFEPYSGPEQLARIALIDYESPVPFVRPGEARSDFTVIFAGLVFGCGSSRETAPQALHYAGVRAVVARSFARIFYRNCINMGLILPIQLEHDLGVEVIGAHVEIDLDERVIDVLARRFAFPSFGPVAGIIEAGGLTKLNQRAMAAMKREEGR
jgi:3-isopropylmalate/(R)-2-methylmalate dehydratase small subunit